MTTQGVALRVAPSTRTPICIPPTLTAANEGEPHLSTVDGLHYDFQSAGEFVSLRDAGGNGQGVEIQTRQTPITTVTPYTNPYTGLATAFARSSSAGASTHEPPTARLADRLCHSSVALGQSPLMIDSCC